MFDPYYRWLGIPPDSRPPTYYQLLGLAAGESDRDVIEEAAIRQSTHLRAYQLGEHAGLCTKLLNEIALAKTTLLNPAKKRAYDQELARKHPAAATTAHANARVPRDLENDQAFAPGVVPPRRPVQKFSAAVLYAALAAGLGALALAGIVALVLLRERPTEVAVAPLAKNQENNIGRDKEDPHSIETPGIEAPGNDPEPAPPIETEVKPTPKKKKGGAGFTFRVLLTKQDCQDLAWMPDRSLVAAATTPVRLIDGRSHKVLETITDPENRLTAVRRVAFSRDGTQLLIACGNYGGNTALQERDTKALRFMSPSGDLSQGNAVIAAALTANGRWVVTTHAKGRLRVFDGATGAETHLLEAAAAQRACRFLADGHTLLTGGDDGILRRWDVETGVLQKQYPIPAENAPAGITCLDVSPDERVVLLGYGKQLRRFDLTSETAQKTSIRFQDSIAGVAFANDGSLYGVVDEGGHFTLVNERAKTSVRKVVHLTKVHALGFGPDDQSVWFASARGVAPLPFATIGFGEETKK
jgi:hypothetical protein